MVLAMVNYVPTMFYAILECGAYKLSATTAEEAAWEGLSLSTIHNSFLLDITNYGQEEVLSKQSRRYHGSTC